MITSPFDFSTPFRIGSVAIPNRVVLAPMAGLTSSAYRLHLKAHGAGLVTTEMVSAYGLVHGNKRTDDYLWFEQEERPIAVQLFGDTPEIMAHAARLVLERRPEGGAAAAPVPDLLDINMGCPVRKVFRTGAGSALLADPERAVAMAAAVVKAASEYGVPVTVKLRSGVQEGERTAVDLAPGWRRSAWPLWGYTRGRRASTTAGSPITRSRQAVVRAVGIPVIASGDVMSVSAARRSWRPPGRPPSWWRAERPATPGWSTRC